MTDSNNVIIVGGGHNGLVCASYLSKAGRKVTVLEAGEQVGGAAATREFTPGFRASCAHLLYLLDKDISKELALEANGFKVAKTGLKTIALADDGRHISIGADSIEGSGLSAEDKAAYSEYRRFMSKFAAVIAKLHNRDPPRITMDRGNLFALRKLALDIRMLGRDEMREFLRGRAMVPYHEGWMGQVDTMKKLQGWSDVTITHYHELATTGEAVLISVRHGPWATTNDQEEAKTWADYWRPEIQRYIYAYKAVSGADLTVKPVSAVMPARLLQARLTKQQAAMGLR